MMMTIPLCSTMNFLIFGEKTTHYRLTAMDNISDLVEEWKKFASFLTVAQKFNYKCLSLHFSHFLSRKINLENDSFPN